ncbi:MAG TPA: vitamin K epoxide reductase family protein [Polyangiaceae bacterium]|nr:vitamin K epoxide reductase family protein [Polyangiaceae bacterium]
MFGRGSKAPAAIALFASLLGLLFASYSTLDYAEHLDRRLHDVHCSFIPGAAATGEAEACRAAMYSPYSALLKDQYWGGLPISLFALGAFCFFAAFSLYLLLSGERAPRRAGGFFALVGVTPLLVSILMLTISLTQLGQLCKTCVGIYISSFLLAFGSLSFWLANRAERSAPLVSVPLLGAWLAVLGITTLTPALVYAASTPDQRPYLTQCGEIKQAKIKGDSPIKLRGSRAVQPSMLFEDPLCPTCKAFHDRLVIEDIIEKLDIELVMFPLDSECNWMLDRPLHPGACIVSKAVLCGEGNSRQVLEWAYAEQEYLTRAGKAGSGVLRAAIKQRWGEAMLRCVDDRKTDVRLNNHLHFASENNIPVSTPQMYLGKRRICDEDTDLGLRYTLKQLAPEVLK